MVVVRVAAVRAGVGLAGVGLALVGSVAKAGSVVGRAAARAGRKDLHRSQLILSTRQIGALGLMHSPKGHKLTVQAFALRLRRLRCLVPRRMRNVGSVRVGCRHEHGMRRPLLRGHSAASACLKLRRRRRPRARRLLQHSLPLLESAAEVGCLARRHYRFGCGMVFSYRTVTKGGTGTGTGTGAGTGYR